MHYLLLIYVKKYGKILYLKRTNVFQRLHGLPRLSLEYRYGWFEFYPSGNLINGLK